MLQHKSEERKRRKGIYLLPNLFTTAALFSGFYAIIAAINGNFETAAIAVFISMVFDGLDGRVARLTHTQSDFGAQYDSLADMVSFGLAPALTMYTWSLLHLGKWGWLATFIYTATAALRLARFNTQIGKVDKSYFQGLASPSAAAVVSGFVWLGYAHQIDGKTVAFFSFIITIAAGILMVSNIRYHSFKDLDLKGRVPFMTILTIVLIFALISIDPPKMLFASFALYAISGPMHFLMKKNRQRQNPSSDIEEDEDEDELDDEIDDEDTEFPLFDENDPNKKDENQ